MAREIRTAKSTQENCLKEYQISNCVITWSFHRLPLRSLRKQGSCLVFLNIAATQSEPWSINNEAWRVEQPSVLLCAAAAVFTHNKVNNERSRRPHCFAARTSPASWLSNKRCRWCVKVSLGAVMTTTTALRVVNVSSNAKVEIRDVLHFERGSMPHNHFTHVVLSAKLQLIVQHVPYDDTVKTSEGITVG